MGYIYLDRVGYIGEIRLFAGTFAPRNWAFCDGQLMAPTQYEALYSLLRTTYGGDGVSTFALPDMRGRLPVHQGTGPGLTPRSLGESFGEAEVTLTEEQIPSHNHPMQASATQADQYIPGDRILATTADGLKIYSTNSAENDTQALSSAAISDTGDATAHTNSMPTLGLNFIICLDGIYPQKN